MDPYTNILNHIQEVQYLVRKMRNEIDCCLKATLTVKTHFRELATALTEEEEISSKLPWKHESISKLKKGTVGKPQVDTKSEITFCDLQGFEHSGPPTVCENDSVTFSSTFVTKITFVGSWCPSPPFKFVPVFVPPPAKPPDKSINMLQMLDSHIIFKLPKFVILHGLEGALVAKRSDFDMLRLVRSEHLPTLISSLQIKVTIRIRSIDFLPPWVLDMSSIGQGNEQLLFEAPSYNLSIYSFCNSTVCENAPATFHSDSNMPCPLYVSRCTLIDWVYVQLMLAWYLRFLNSYILLWIEENVQWHNFRWLFDLACHSRMRLETETYVLGDLEDVRFVSLNMGSLVAAAKYRVDFQDILRATLKEVEENDTKIILFEICLVFSAGKTKGLMEAANQLKPMLYKGRLRCTDALTLGEFQQYVEKDASIGKRCNFADPSIIDTIRIFRGLEVKYDSHQDARFQDKALTMAALLLAQNIGGPYLCDKANDFGDEVCEGVQTRLSSLPEKIANLERKPIHLEVEVHALEREKDKASKTHVVGGSIPVLRDTPVDNLNKQIKITLFFKKYQLEFFEERRQKHLQFTFIYYHMRMTNLDNTIMESGWLLDRFMNFNRILVFHVCVDIYISISWELSRKRSSYKEVKHLIVLRDLWSLVTLEENDQWLVIDTNTFIDIHKLTSINVSSYNESIVK